MGVNKMTDDKQIEQDIVDAWHTWHEVGGFIKNKCVPDLPNPSFKIGYLSALEKIRKDNEKSI